MYYYEQGDLLIDACSPLDVLAKAIKNIQVGKLTGGLFYVNYKGDQIATVKAKSLSEALKSRDCWMAIYNLLPGDMFSEDAYIERIS